MLWITPLRALAADTREALGAPVDDLDLPWTLESRTGDTSAAARARQRRRLPSALITTPESFSLLLTREDAPRTFGSLRAVIVDEWHELMGTKRGVQVELALARLRALQPAAAHLGAVGDDRQPATTARDALLGTAPARAVSCGATTRRRS